MPSFSIGDPGWKADPGPQLAHLRAAGPLAPIHVPFLGRIAMTTTHAAAERVLKDKDGFVSNPATAGLKKSLAPRWTPRRVRLLMRNMLLQDEPDHRRLRRLVDTAFARVGVAALAPAIEAQTTARLDRVDPAGFDLMTALARPLPLDAIALLLGVPRRDLPAFEAASRRIAHAEGGLAMLWALLTLGPLTDFVEGKIAAARAGDAVAVAPDGLIAALVEAEEEGDWLDAEELTAMALTLLMAGSETTTHLITGGAWALLTHPEQRARLREEDVSIEETVEELLRWLSPVMITKPRFAAADTAVEGAPVKRGDMVTGGLIAANHDPAKWEDPARLDLGRKPAGHLAFGAGIHFCLGLSLARLEAQIALRQLFERFPDLALTEEPVWTARPGIRSMRALRVKPGV